MSGLNNILFILVVLQTIDVCATCTEVTTLRSVDKRARNNVVDGVKEHLINDFYLDEDWYSVGEYRMPDIKSMPPHGTCGSFDVIYIDDNTLDTNTLTSKPVDVTVCINDGFDPCDKTITIKMRKCEVDIQYYLVRTPDRSAYCFDPPELQGVEEIALPPNNVQIGQLEVKPDLKFSTQTSQSTGLKRYSPRLEFTCLFNWEDTYFYEVFWYIDGEPLTSYGPHKVDKQIETILDEEKLIEKNITMGFMITCGVRARSDANGMPTIMTVSEQYFAGIKYVENHIKITKDTIATVNLRLTVPLGCQYHHDNDTCAVGLRMFDPKQEDCDVNGAVVELKDSNKCGQEIQALKFQEKWDPSRIYTFNLTTKDETYNDETLFRLTWKVEETARHTLWRSYKPDDVTISVYDSNVYKEKICYSHVDPHMRTADGYYFENQAEGTYMLYRNKQYQIEVQEKLAKCNKNKAWCACGVAIKAGADVFIVNRCNGKAFAEFRPCNDGGILRVTNTTNMLQVYTPIGTKIQITLHSGKTRPAYEGLMNVDITMAPKDLGNLEGLCGYFDGDYKNDLKKRNGDIIPTKSTNTYAARNFHRDFTSDWRVTAEEDLFALNRTLLKWHDEGNQLYCVCNAGDTQSIVTSASCNPSQYAACNEYGEYSTGKCHKMNNKKRSLHLKHRREIERLLRESNIAQEGNSINVHKRAVTTVNMTETEARRICNNAIQGSLAVREFSNQTAGENPSAVVEQCTFDVQVGNDESLAGVHVESLNNIVKTIFEKEIEYVEKNPDHVTFFKKNTCSNNCSDVGTCSDEGICQCNDHYHGADCSIDDRDPVEILDLEGGGTCNITDGDGCTCFYFRTLDLLPNFFCHVSGEKTYVTNETEILPTSTANGEQEDIFTGICCVPDTSRIRRSAEQDNVFTTRYDISVSNDGVHAGANRSMTIFDSTCQDLRYENNDITVELKGGFCFIDSQCVREGETKILDQKFICTVKLNKYQWTIIVEKEEASNTGLIVGLTVGLTMGAVAVIIVAVVIKTKFVPRLKQRKSVGDSSLYFHTG